MRLRSLPTDTSLKLRTPVNHIDIKNLDFRGFRLKVKTSGTMAAEKLRQKIIAKLQNLIPSIVDESIDEVLKEENITINELSEQMHQRLSLKPKPVSGDREKKIAGGYNKLPQDETEVVDWMRKLVKKRRETKLGDEKDENKIFNIITQRFIKRSSCQSRKDCTMEEVEFEGQKVGFTDGGVEPRLNESEQFRIFHALFFKPEVEEPEEEENPQAAKDELDISMDAIMEELEKKGKRTVEQLKKVVQEPSNLPSYIQLLEDEGKIVKEGKYISVVYKEETEEELEKSASGEDEE